MKYVAFVSGNESLLFSDVRKIDERRRDVVALYDSVIGSYIYEREVFTVKYITKEQYDSTVDKTYGMLKNAWVPDTILKYKKILSKDAIAYREFADHIAFLYPSKETVNKGYTLLEFVKDSITYHVYTCSNTQLSYHNRIYRFGDSTYICEVPKHKSLYKVVLDRLNKGVSHVNNH